MLNDLPPEIDVVTTPQGERYELPARDVGCVKIAAVPLILFGLVFFAAGLYTSLIEGGVLELILPESGLGGGKPFDIFNALFGLPFVLIGLGVMYLGVMIAGGRSVIELRDDRLIATQRSGPFRWRRKIALGRVRKFQVKSGNVDDAAVAIGAALSALNAVLVSGRMCNLAWGYSKSTLRALADHLAERCEAAKGARLVAGDEAGIEVEERTLGQDRLIDTMRGAKGDEPDDVDGVPPRPGDSEVILETHDAGLTLTVPPVGIRKGGKGALGFSIFWNGFMAVFTFFWFYAGGFKIGWELLMICGFLSLFWAIGIGVMISAINAGRRRAILDVVGDTLLITRQNIFKTRQQEVRRENIKSIRRDKSGVEVNNVPVLNLQVRLHEGKKISMFSQLSNDELAWLAAVLRGALDVPSG